MKVLYSHMTLSLFISVWLIGASLLLINTALRAQTLSTEQLHALDTQNLRHTDQYRLIQVDEEAIPLFESKSHQPLMKGVVYLVADNSQGMLNSQSQISLTLALQNLGWNVIRFSSPALVEVKEENVDAELVDVDDAPSALDDETLPVEKENTLVTALNAQNEENNTDAVAAEKTDDVVSKKDETSVLLAIEKANAFTSGLSLSDIPAVNDASFSSFEEKLISRVNVMSNETSNTKGYRLIITSGITAATLAKLFNEGILPLPDGMVINNPYLPSRTMNLTVPTVIATTSFPILDLTTGADNHWSIATRPARKTAAVVELKEQYRQKNIVGSVLGSNQSLHISKEIYGWTSYLGW